MPSIALDPFASVINNMLDDWNAGLSNNTTTNPPDPHNAVTDTFTASPSNQPLTRSGYPDIYGATTEEAQEIWGDMAAMPPEDRQSVNSIHVGNDYTTAAFQVTQNGQNYGDIYINANDLSDPQKAKYIVLHESGHAVAYHDGTLNGPTSSVWNGADIYANGGPGGLGQDFENNVEHHTQAETFANAYAAYYGGDGEKLQEVAPDEYDALASRKYKGTAQSSLGDEIASGFVQAGEWISDVVGSIAPGLVASGVNYGLATIGTFGGIFGNTPWSQEY